MMGMDRRELPPDVRGGPEADRCPWRPDHSSDHLRHENGTKAPAVAGVGAVTQEEDHAGGNPHFPELQAGKTLAPEMDLRVWCQQSRRRLRLSHLSMHGP